MKTKFDLGSTGITQGINALIEQGKEKELRECARRHADGDWGIVSENDAKLNDADAEFLAKGENARVLSAYEIDGTKIWIITEGNAAHRVTTALLPSEY